MIINELQHTRPVLYIASDPTNQYTHMFIIDQYSQVSTDSVLFHCNWGGGGIRVAGTTA